MSLLTRALVFVMPPSAFFLLAGCLSLVDSVHQNFLNINQGEVGRYITDPDSMRNRYIERRVSTKVLPNGNLEEEFLDGRRLKCRSFFEVDNKAKKIIAWRYEGTKQDCAITP